MTIGPVTLEVGQQALVYDKSGRGRLEDGPKRLFLWRERIRFLHCHRADQNQYLVIKQRNGELRHEVGPCAMFENDLEHEEVTVKNGISLDANEVLIVYKRDPTTADVTRYQQHGPTVFMPKANEWLHQFTWHGTDPDNKTRKLPGKMKFTKLQAIPDQFYYNVDMVRTSDDALIRIKLMMFYELQDIEKMLNETIDPMADFINCLTADVIAFASRLTYMEFIEKSSELNDLESYPQLVMRCNDIGYEVSKVAFRGYYASPTLQNMHDSTIRKRTELKMAFEKEEQTQALNDLTLQSEMNRIKAEQELVVQQLKHKLDVEKSQKEHDLKLEQKNNESKTTQWTQTKMAEVEQKSSNSDAVVANYQKMRDLGVDVNAVVENECRPPEKVVRFVTEGQTGNLHFHHSP